MKADRTTNPLFIAALELQTFFMQNSWPFCFIGGLAVMRWGEMRVTQDVDLCLQCGFGRENEYIKNLLKEFNSRISDAEKFAKAHRVLLLKTTNEINADVTLSGLDYEVEMIQRATLFPYTDTCSLLTCSAEDLIVLKAFADRPRDWMDVETIIQRQQKKLDRKAILERLHPLCIAKEQPDILKKLEQIFLSINE